MENRSGGAEKFDVIGSTCIGYWLRNLSPTGYWLGQVKEKMFETARYTLQLAESQLSFNIRSSSPKLFLWPTTFNGAVPKTHCRLQP